MLKQGGADDAELMSSKHTAFSGPMMRELHTE